MSRKKFKVVNFFQGRRRPWESQGVAKGGAVAGCSFIETAVRRITAIGVSFRGCRMGRMTVDDCDLRGTVLEGCETRGIVFRHGAGWTGRPRIVAGEGTPDLAVFVERKLSMRPANAVLASVAGEPA